MRYLYSVLALVLLLSIVPATYAQGGNYDRFADAQTGRPHWGSFFEGGLDSINLYNGNVMLDLPLLVQPGRELSTGLRLTYNSQNWEVIVQNYASIFPYGRYTGGWRLYDPIGERPVYTVLNTACWEGAPSQEEWTVWAWWFDGFGTKHRYFTTLYVEVEQCYVNGPPPIDNLLLLGTDLSGYDGSELWTGASPYETVLRFPDGSVIEFTANPTFRTANGNYLTRGSNGLPVQDTVGRVIGVETNKADPALEYYKRYTVTDADGNPQVYTLNYVDNHPVWRPTDWNPGWTTINDVLVSIELPGGQSYSFEYNHPQGFLTKVTLPTGATISYSYPAANPYAFHNDYVISRTLSDGITSQTWGFSRKAALPGDVIVTFPEGNRVLHFFDAMGLEVETRAQESSGEERERVTKTWYGASPSSITTKREGKERKTNYGYVPSPNYALVVSQVEETDWHDTTTSGSMLSRTNYHWSWPVSNVPSQRLDAVELWGVNPESQQFELQGRTEYFYDQFNLTTTQNVPNKGTPASFRGNLTTVRRYSSPASYVEDHYEYDDLGNILRHIDPLGHPEVFSYADSFSDSVNRNSYAYRTQVTNALGHTSSSVYHFSTGLLKRITDARGMQTVFEYDARNRPQSIRLPSGGVQSWLYDEVNRKVTESTGGSGHTTETYLDKFSRPVKTVNVDVLAGNVQVDTEYDFNGRPKRVSEPYRSGQPSWNTTSYDALDRITLVSGPDGNPVEQYTYRENTVDDGNRVLAYDALGRLVRVSVGSIATLYSYYAFGPLYQVSGQTRTFAHDWLGRQTRQTHPESGTTTYQYDAASRLASRSDARGVATYTYDAIDRLLSVSYSGGIATPSVNYAYDQNGYVGLCTSMQDGLGTLRYTYNASSQISSEQRTFFGVAGTLTAGYLYDTEGKLTRATYPSGRVVDYSYQAGTSRLNSVQDQTTGTPVVSGIIDNAAGHTTNRTLGNDVVLNRSFNGLNQPATLSATRRGTTLMDLQYGYSSGRIATRTDALQPEHSVRFDYDSVRRLQSVTGTALNWSISWQFDDWGNRTTQTPTGFAVGRVGSQSIGYANNRVVTPAWNYDAAGNVIFDGIHHYYYDAESRLINVDSSEIQYAYDGEGRRARKTVAGTSTYYFYGQLGLMSEFSTNSFLSAASGSTSTDRLSYPLSEPTGTAIVLTDADGTVRENNRVLPYGEPWVESPANLSANDQKFTTYQRDNESGLDYALARYYGSRMGRFLTPDPDAVSASLKDPQSWNAYIYAGNDPVNNADSSGTDYYRVCFDEGECFDAGEGQEHTWEWVQYEARRMGITMPSMNGYFGASEIDWIRCPGQAIPVCGSVTYIITENPHSFIDDIANGIGAGILEGIVGVGGSAVSTVGRSFVSSITKRIASKVVPYSPLKPGPLAADIVATFRGGSYTARILSEPTTFYRVIGKGGNPTGSFWAATAPSGPVQASIDFALLPEWGNTATYVIRAEVPAGTIVYQGVAASQGGLVGGGIQVYIPNVNPAWINPARIRW